MKSKLLLLLLILTVVFLSCEKDNREAPSSTISGTVMYGKQPLSVRSNGVQLELWQHGYQLFSKIPVYINQDGTFSAKVFDGNYKLTLLKGNGPWADQTDSIDVTVKGSTQVDVPVNPYFTINNETFQKNGTTIVATFNLQEVDTSKALDLAKIYIGQTIITDENNNAANAQIAAADITDVSQPITLSVDVPASLATKEYIYVRVGVKTAGRAELLYSPPQMIMLK